MTHDHEADAVLSCPEADFYHDLLVKYMRANTPPFVGPDYTARERDVLEIVCDVQGIDGIGRE